MIKGFKGIFQSYKKDIFLTIEIKRNDLNKIGIA